MLKQVDQLIEQLSQKDTFIDKLKGIIAGLKNKIAELVQTLYGAGTFADRDGQLGALWSTEMGSYD